MSTSRRFGWVKGAAALAVAAQLAACGSIPRVAYTADQAAAAVPAGMDLSVRAYADASENNLLL